MGESSHRRTCGTLWNSSSPRWVFGYSLESTQLVKRPSAVASDFLALATLCGI